MDLIQKYLGLIPNCDKCMDRSVDGSVGFNYIPDIGYVNLKFCDKKHCFIKYECGNGLCKNKGE